MSLFRSIVLIANLGIVFTTATYHSPVLPSSPPAVCAYKPSPINSTQALEGADFIGHAVRPRHLRPTVQISPRSSTLHADNANTGSVDYPGPLGHDLNVTAVGTQIGLLYFDDSGTMYGYYVGPCNGSEPISAITVINPDTLAIEATWQVPAEYRNSTLNTAYMQVLKETDQIVLSVQSGQIFVLQKCEPWNGVPHIDLTRLIDLAPSGVLGGKTLFNTMMDADGNIWFTTGAADGVGIGTATNSSTIGYVEPNGTIHSLQVPNQSIGQGLSVSNTTCFVNTQPSGDDDHANAVGFLSALQPGPGTSVNVLWNASYDAGSARKPGALARGSGTTPSLLGHDFVAITDNADEQINLVIYPQHASGSHAQPICKVPLWERNASWTDNGPMVHYDGQDYGVVVVNMYNDPPFAATHANLSGPWNSLAGMAPGISKVHVAGNGSGCYVEWTNPGRTTTLPLLSTVNGLIYEYEQDIELAKKGEYVWYVVAIDYMSGESVWKARTGAGGLFNNNLRTTFLSPEGTLYQMVEGGVVAVKDGQC